MGMYVPTVSNTHSRHVFGEFHQAGGEGKSFITCSEYVRAAYVVPTFDRFTHGDIHGYVLTCGTGNMIFSPHETRNPIAVHLVLKS